MVNDQQQHIPDQAAETPEDQKPKEKSKGKGKRRPREYSPEVLDIAKRLNEDDRKPLVQIERIVKHCGSEFTDLMVESTLAIEESGGMLTANGDRRRTPGGVFFFIVRHALPEDMRERIFPQFTWKNRKPLPPSPFPPIDWWEDRVEELDDALQKPIGKVEEVNINLKGRPAHVEKRAGFFIATLDHPIPDNQSFPRGLPEPPNDATRYFLLISEQQWNKHVGDKLEEDEENGLEVDGGCYYDEELDGVAILVRAVKIHKPKPKEAAEPKLDPEREKHAQKAKAVTAKTAPSPAPPVHDETPDLSKFPDDIAKKLRPLYGARKLFRKRLADIQAMPVDKQSGLQAAKMMLERTEKQIEALEQQAGDS